MIGRRTGLGRIKGVFQVVERDVKPERQRRKPDGSFALRKPLPDRYWQFADNDQRCSARLQDSTG